MSKDDEHIIDWIIKKTDFRANRERFREKKKAAQFDNRKHKIDNMIFYCLNCNCCWSYVTKYIDGSGWRKYPENNIPTIGKKRKKCLNCRRKNGKP